MKRNVFFLMVIGLALIGACSSDGGDGGGTPTDDDGQQAVFARGELLANWADNIIIPSYNSFLAELDTFKSAFESFRADRSEANLVALRSSWLAAYKSWQQVSMFEIGPAEQLGLRLNVNIYPANVTLIEDNVASGSYNLELSSNRPAKGFPALDYLINGLEANDASIVSRYNTAITGEAYLNYFADLVADIETLVTSVRDDWQNGFRDTFVNNDGSSATASVDRMVNDYIFYYERFLRAGKMGIPLGIFSGSVAPNTVEAFFRPEVSNELFLDGLNAVQDFFNGKHFGSSATGESLASYLDALDTQAGDENLADLINDQFNTARTAVSGLGSFREEIENNNPPTSMNMAYDEVQRIVPLLKVDMVSALSISIDFVDADGD